MARLVLGDGPRRVRPRVGPGQTVAVARRRRRYGPATRWRANAALSLSVSCVSTSRDKTEARRVKNSASPGLKVWRVLGVGGDFFLSRGKF